MNFIANLMRLNELANQETKELFSQFCAAALASHDANAFIRNALRAALNPPEPEPTVVTATVIDCTKGGSGRVKRR
jgi:hypothetical protein